MHKTNEEDVSIKDVRAHLYLTSMKNAREDGHCYTELCVDLTLLEIGGPYISFQKQILFTIINTLSKNEQKLSVGS